MSEQLKTLRKEITAALDRFEGVERHENADAVGSPPTFDPDIYREDGFSIEVSKHGARRHALVDEAIEDLRAAGFDRVANDQDQWFTFGPDYAGDLLPEDPAQAEQWTYSYNESWGESQWIAESKKHPVKRAFKLKRDPQIPMFNLYYRKIDGTATIFLPTGWTAVQAMADIASNLQDYIEDHTKPQG